MAINNTPTMKEIFKKYMPNGKRKGIIFIQEIDDKPYVLEIFKNIYPDIEYRAIDSKMDKKEVEANREWFERTKEGYLIAINMISEGAHYSGVNTLIMFRRTSSYLVYTQQLGRIITLTTKQNPNAIVFDLVNNADNVKINDRQINREKKIHSISKILAALKEQTKKSEQIIVADETREIVSVIKKIKDYENRTWQPWEDDIIREYYPKYGAKVCMEKINNRTSVSFNFRTREQIRDRATKHLSITRNWKKREVFTPQEQNIVKQYYLAEKGDVIKRLSNHSAEGVELLAYRLGIRTRAWSKAEDQIILSLYLQNPQECIHRIAQINPNRTAMSIKRRSLELGLSTAPKRWTQYEDSIIKQYYPSEGKGMYKRLENRSPSSIQARANKLGVIIEPVWSTDELLILEEYYEKEGIEVTNRLPAKTKDAIRAKVGKLGLRSCSKNAPTNNVWTEKEDLILKQYYPTDMAKAQALLGRSQSAIQSRASLLGIKRLTKNYWTQEEDEILKKYYPLEGRVGCHERLPHRVLGAIKSRARLLGLEYIGPAGKKVKCVETSEVFLSVSDVASFMGVSRTTLRRVINKQSVLGGYHWEYVDEEGEEND